MKVDVLTHTKNPERTVCTTARGDEMDMSMVDIDLTDDIDYGRVMDSVPYDEDDVDAVTSDGFGNLSNHSKRIECDAKTKALIQRLIRTYGHYGPFEHANITFAAENVSVVVERQVTRHRHVTWDVQSLRYVELDDLDAVIPASMQQPGKFNAPGEETPDYGDAGSFYEQWTDKQFEFYKQMVEEGVDKEDARYVLPMGTPINMTFTMNLRTLMHLVDMRDAANVQPETIEFAKKVLDAAEDVAPYTIEAYREYGKGKSKDAP